MMMNRVRDVKAMPGYKLDIVFRDGVHGIFDCNPYRDYECLQKASLTRLLPTMAR